MDWCRLSTRYYLDAALLRAGEPAEVLFMRCLAYSGAEESRGVVPRHVLPMLAPTKTKARVDALLREGLLVAHGQNDVLIRSWERWQESLDSEADRRRKDRERKAKKRAEERDKSEDVSADVSADIPQTVQAKSARIEVEEEEDQQTSSVGGRKRPKRATRAPESFPITAALAAWGRENAPLVVDPKRETEQFLDHHRAKGSTFADWSAAWRTWMGNAQKYAERDGGRPTLRVSGRGEAPPGTDSSQEWMWQ